MGAVNYILKSFQSFAVNDDLLAKVVEAVRAGEKEANTTGNIQSFEVFYKGFRQNIAIGRIYVVPPKVANDRKNFPIALLYGCIMKEFAGEELADLITHKIGETEFDEYSKADFQAIKDKLFKTEDGYECIVLFAPHWHNQREFVHFKFTDDEQKLANLVRHLIFCAYFDPRLSSAFNAMMTNIDTTKFDVTDITPKLNFPFLAEGVLKQYPELQKAAARKMSYRNTPKTFLTIKTADEITQDVLDPQELDVFESLDQALTEALMPNTTPVSDFAEKDFKAPTQEIPTATVQAPMPKSSAAEEASCVWCGDIFPDSFALSDHEKSCTGTKSASVKTANAPVTEISGNYFPEAVGHEWNKAKSNDLTSTYSKQVGGYFQHDVATSGVKAHIENHVTGVEQGLDALKDHKQVTSAKSILVDRKQTLAKKADTADNPANEKGGEGAMLPKTDKEKAVTANEVQPDVAEAKAELDANKAELADNADATKTVNPEHFASTSITCEQCDGEGEVEGAKCPECHGTGKVKGKSIAASKNCPECKGTGVTTDLCPECDGEGCEECEDEGGANSYVEQDCQRCHGSGKIAAAKDTDKCECGHTRSDHNPVAGECKGKDGKVRFCKCNGRFELYKLMKKLKASDYIANEIARPMKDDRVAMSTKAKAALLKREAEMNTKYGNRKKADVPMDVDDIFAEITEEFGPAPEVELPGGGSSGSSGGGASSALFKDRKKEDSKEETTTSVADDKPAAKEEKPEASASSSDEKSDEHFREESKTASQLGASAVDVVDFLKRNFNGMPIPSNVIESAVLSIASKNGLNSEQLMDSVIALANSNTHQASAKTKTADYNGWSNWLTWHVALLIDNEESSYNAKRNLCQAALKKRDKGALDLDKLAAQFSRVFNKQYRETVKFAEGNAAHDREERLQARKEMEARKSRDPKTFTMKEKMDDLFGLFDDGTDKTGWDDLGECDWREIATSAIDAENDEISSAPEKEVHPFTDQDTALLKEMRIKSSDEGNVHPETAMTEKEVHDLGFERGRNVGSWVDAPEVGTKLPRHIDYVGYGTVTHDNLFDVMEMMAVESESSERNISEFRFTKKELDDLNGHVNFDVWQVFEEGVSEGIRAGVGSTLGIPSTKTASEGQNWEGLLMFVKGLSSHGVYSSADMEAKVRELGFEPTWKASTLAQTVNDMESRGLGGEIRSDAPNSTIDGFEIAESLCEKLCHDTRFERYSGRGARLREAILGIEEFVQKNKNKDFNGFMDSIGGKDIKQGAAGDDMNEETPMDFGMGDLASIVLDEGDDTPVIDMLAQIVKSAKTALKFKGASADLIESDTQIGQKMQTTQEPAVLGGELEHTEPPNQNAMREAIETQAETEVGKPIAETQAEVKQPEIIDAKPGKQIIINIASEEDFSIGERPAPQRYVAPTISFDVRGEDNSGSSAPPLKDIPAFAKSNRSENYQITRSWLEVIAPENSIKIEFDYPFDFLFTKTFKSPTGKGFTRLDFAKCVYEGYKQIYALPREKRVKDFESHNMNSLYLEGARQKSPGVYVLYMGS
jgi:hypothetical protein